MLPSLELEFHENRYGHLYSVSSNKILSTVATTERSRQLRWSAGPSLTISPQIRKAVRSALVFVFRKTSGFKLPLSQKHNYHLKVVSGLVEMSMTPKPIILDSGSTKLLTLIQEEFTIHLLSTISTI